VISAAHDLDRASSGQDGRSYYKPFDAARHPGMMRWKHRENMFPHVIVRDNSDEAALGP